MNILHKDARQFIKDIEVEEAEEAVEAEEAAAATANDQTHERLFLATTGEVKESSINYNTTQTHEKMGFVMTTKNSDLGSTTNNNKN